MIAEGLRGGDAGCSREEYRHKMTKEEAQACHWGPHSYKQINNCFPLKRNTDLELDKTTFFMDNRTKNKFLAYTRCIIDGKFGYHVEL